MSTRMIIFSLMIMIFTSLISVDNEKKILYSATEAYKLNDFDKALSLYSELETRNQKNPDIYYNIGNCYFRLNRIGLAILYYKKALLIDSSHSLAKKNLNFALKFTLDKQDFENQNFLSNIINTAYQSLSLNALAWITLILLTGLVTVIHAMIRKGQDYTHTKQMMLMIMLAFNLVFIAWSGTRFYHYKHNNEAVISSSKVNAYSGPGENYTKLFTIHEGLIIKINKIDNAWTLVSLSNGFSGWVRTSTYKVVAI
ncbi:MAG TPA: tetratricopeptide repeat protein [Candidatus Cloacimonadota bacterium]|nr:tetratricopeptide repeat protein [Candidatus Cloacimonadota bacterium]HPM01201.1 tetratricopeptide repeat protein [Candidatus Cloacimonadota bacterium]